MGQVWHIALLSSSLVTLAVAPAFAQFSQTPAPVTGAAPAVMAPSSLRLEDIAAQISRGREAEAVTTLKALVNSPDTTTRAKARYLLAQALQRQGKVNEALTALEGTLADESPLGRALGSLRGQLFLQEAELALMTGATDKAARALADYERNAAQPDRTRFKRLHYALAAPAATQAPLRVGVLVPQTGQLGAAGTDILRAMQLGLQQFAMGGRPVELIAADAATPAQTEAAAAFLRSQQVSLVVGPLLAPTVPVAVQKLGGVPLLTLSSDAAALQSGVHTLNFLPSAQAETAAKAALANGRSRFAALVPQGAYGEAALNGLRRAVEAGGATLVKTVVYNPGETDIGASIRELGTGFDALLLPTQGRAAPLVASQLAYYDLDRAGVQLLGTALWNEPTTLAGNATMLKGATFAAPARNPDFVQAFTQTFGAAPHPLAALGYDAAALLGQVALAQSATGNAPSQILLRPEGFYAPGGYLKFNTNGQTERGLGLVEIDSDAGKLLFAERRIAPALAPLPLPVPLLPGDAPKSWW